MSKAKSAAVTTERSLITSQNPKRPYGVKVSFQVSSELTLEALENMTLLMVGGTIARVERLESVPHEAQRYRARLEGFARASEAEDAGRRLVQSLLLLAVGLDFGLRLNYRAHDAALVFERFRSKGLTMSARGSVYWPQPIVLDAFDRVQTCPSLSPPILMSMELYSAAVLEQNPRARFIGIVSALEPLADQASLGDDVGAFVDESLARLLASASIPQKLKISLRGRLDALRKESVRQALQRLCTEWFPERPKIWTTIDAAYGIRSKLVHEGDTPDPDVDLSEESGKISVILRTLYQKCAGFEFRATPRLPD